MARERIYQLGDTVLDGTEFFVVDKPGFCSAKRVRLIDLLEWICDTPCPTDDVIPLGLRFTAKSNVGLFTLASLPLGLRFVSMTSGGGGVTLVSLPLGLEFVGISSGGSGPGITLVSLPLGLEFVGVLGTNVNPSVLCPACNEGMGGEMPTDICFTTSGWTDGGADHGCSDCPTLNGSFTAHWLGGGGGPLPDTPLFCCWQTEPFEFCGTSVYWSLCFTYLDPIYGTGGEWVLSVQGLELLFDCEYRSNETDCSLPHTLRLEGTCYQCAPTTGSIPDITIYACGSPPGLTLAQVPFGLAFVGHSFTGETTLADVPFGLAWTGRSNTGGTTLADVPFGLAWTGNSSTGETTLADLPLGLAITGRSTAGYLTVADVPLGLRFTGQVTGQPVTFASVPLALVIVAPTATWHVGETCDFVSGDTPENITVSMAGWTNAACSDCSLLNTDFVCHQTSGGQFCQWHSSPVFLCGGSDSCTVVVASQPSGWWVFVYSGTGLASFHDASSTLPATLTLFSNTQLQCTPPLAVSITAGP